MKASLSLKVQINVMQRPFSYWKSPNWYKLILVKARSAVKIFPHLEKGNIIAGGGNSYKNYALDFISKVNITAGY
jgi:hypothetical protein